MNSTQQASEKVKETLKKADLPWYKRISYLIGVLITAAWQKVVEWVKRIPRPIRVLIATIVSCVILWLLYELSSKRYISEEFKTILFIPTVALGLIASPIAFALWCFRNADKAADIENARQVVENARRDTNLKAFQQVQEWASGKHFKQDPPTDTEHALQVSAVHQLGEFFQGVYDDSFRRPAFEILKVLWKIELDQVLKAYPQSEPEANAEVDHAAWQQSGEALRKRMQTPLARALAVSVFGQAGKGFRHESIKDILTGTYWSGLDVNLPDFSGKILNLSKLNLREVTLSGAQLQKADLREADLTEANLQGANLRNANLQGAILRDANLQGANLWDANLEGADLINIEFNDKTSFQQVKVNDQTWIGFWKELGNPTSFDRDKTNQLRKILGIKPLAANEIPSPPPGSIIKPVLS